MVKKILIVSILLGMLFGSILVIYSTISSDGRYYVWGTMVSCISILSYTLIILFGINDQLEDIHKKVDLLYEDKIKQIFEESLEKKN